MKARSPSVRLVSTPARSLCGKNLANVPEFGLVAGWDVSFPGTADPEQFYFKALDWANRRVVIRLFKHESLGLSKNHPFWTALPNKILQ